LASSLAQLVEVVLQGIDLLFDLIKGHAFWRDEQTAILATVLAQ
jgi:hypothetical protein